MILLIGAGNSSVTCRIRQLEFSGEAPPNIHRVQCFIYERCSLHLLRSSGRQEKSHRFLSPGDFETMLFGRKRAIAFVEAPGHQPQRQSHVAETHRDAHQCHEAITQEPS